MAGVSFKQFARMGKLDFERFGQVWPVGMDETILTRLDNCARRARMQSNFAELANLNDVRCHLFDLMRNSDFRRHFVMTFADVLPAIVDAIAHRATLDDLSQYDPTGSFKARLSGAPAPAFA